MRAAVPSDFRAIHALLLPAIEKKIILPITHWSGFVVATDGPKIIGCGRLHDWGEIEELQKLCVDSHYQHYGIASLMIHDLLSRRRNSVFALTVNPKVGSLFERHGFTPIEKISLPNVWKQQYPIDRLSSAYIFQ